MIRTDREQIERIKSAADRKIFVSFKREAIHTHLSASLPVNETVAFLAYPHRHVFHFRVWIGVVNSDIEPIGFKQWLKTLYQTGSATAANGNTFLILNGRSCEELADDMYVQIAGRYPGRSVWIEVAEDGENGCLVKYELTRPAQSIVN